MIQDKLKEEDVRYCPGCKTYFIEETKELLQEWNKAAEIEYCTGSCVALDCDKVRLAFKIYGSW